MRDFKSMYLTDLLNQSNKDKLLSESQIDVIISGQVLNFILFQNFTIS